MQAQHARQLAQQEIDLRRFIEPKGMDIKALGVKTLLKFHGRRLVSTIEDLFSLDIDYILSRGMVKEVNLNKIQNAILRTPGRPLTNVIYALNIPTVGLEHAEALAKHFKTLDVMMKDSDAVFEVPGLTSWVMESVAEWIDKPRSQELTDFLISKRVGMLPYEDPNRGKPLKGQRWYVSECDVRTLALRKKMKRMGATVCTSWSKRLDYAVFVDEANHHQRELAFTQGIKMYTLREAQDRITEVIAEVESKITDPFLLAAKKY